MGSSSNNMSALSGHVGDLEARFCLLYQWRFWLVLQLLGLWFVLVSFNLVWHQSVLYGLWHLF
jgi:hypothetical protein